MPTLTPPAAAFPQHFPTETLRAAERARPAGIAVGHQRWNHLLFAHWTVDPAHIQATLPPGLFVDTHEGAAYVGVVPFFMERIRPAGLPPLPGLSWFLELNVRTYVHDDAGRPGVWFYSLDCNQPIAVAIARGFFHLPYFHADMAAERTDDGGWSYFSQRRGSRRRDHFVWTCDPTAFTPAQPGSLDYFLAERYRLFSVDDHGDLHSGKVHHAPYRLQRPHVRAWSGEVARLAGFELRGPPDSLLAAAAVDVAIFPLRPHVDARESVSASLLSP